MSPRMNVTVRVSYHCKAPNRPVRIHSAPMAAAQRREVRLRIAVGVLLCIVYPLVSWLVPAIAPAWAMYTSTTVFRLDIVAVDHTGVPHHVLPSALVPHASPRTRVILRGADRWKHDFPYHLDTQLDRLADLVCTDARVARAEVTIEVRDAPSRPTRTTRASRRCERGR